MQHVDPNLELHFLIGQTELKQQLLIDVHKAIDLYGFGLLSDLKAT